MPKPVTTAARPLTIAFSPCPNDTFMFAHIADGSESVPGCQARCQLHDIETLNQLAATAQFDITKLSLHAYLLNRDRYQLLETGSALGFGCGPLLVGRKVLDPNNLSVLRIAVPGRLTTAHLLLRLAMPSATRIMFVRYDQVFNAIQDGQCDAGVIIHEGRFVYQQYALQCLLDLGQWWEQTTALPLPLGCIAGRRALGEPLIARVEQTLKRSIQASQAAPLLASRYCHEHAQHIDPQVCAQHIATFVNCFSLELGPTGRAAIEHLQTLARAAGLIP